MTTKHETPDNFRPRGGRLARRARSFKDDILVKINQMRTPSGTRSAGSPKGKKKGGCGKTGLKVSTNGDLDSTPTLGKAISKEVKSINQSVKFLQYALGYLKDVVEKDKLEMLAGSASVVLETVISIYADLKKCLTNEQSSVQQSASSQLYQSVASLLQWADGVQLHPEEAVDREAMHSLVTSLQDAVQSLVKLAMDVLEAKPNGVLPTSPAMRRLEPPPRDLGASPLLPHSTSTDSALSTPPPKPPLPLARALAPTGEVVPPLPPKQRYGGLLGSARSQEWGSSASSSLDSNLNHSADDLLLVPSLLSSADSVDLLEEDPPPALPVKQRQRTPSHYDNVPLLPPEHSPTCPKAVPTHHHSWSHAPSCPARHQTSFSSDITPPPLPPKQKNVMAYMQMFGSYSHPSEGEFFRHSFHSYYHHVLQWQHHLVVESGGVISEPPALPPKRNRASSITPLPPSPVASPPANGRELHHGEEEEEEEEVVAAAEVESEPFVGEPNPLDELEVSQYLVYNKPEEGPSIRGGYLDALIVHATKVSKNDFLYQEAFLTTYRTFLSPLELIQKLLYRYNRLCVGQQRAARNAFALLVRVVDDLCACDVGEVVLRLLMDFTYGLVSRGELNLARALRKVVCEKCLLWHHTQLASLPAPLSSVAISARPPPSLLAFKTEHLAEQMTLLDSHLFLKIEIPEVLLWAKEQKEELSPNLTTFTEHFNKMSYWTRSIILEQEEVRERERHIIKFIKIMKHLRRLNNFNSYLAILSALDSAPIRRLDWGKTITESLKDYGSLIDSSSSFRAYRQALSEAESPCIPYIGLILQDLTFVHIGNSDLLPGGQINFSKRWQAFNILENMRRFKNCQYPFKRSDQIMDFFNNFDNYLCEEALWQLSETIKPRNTRK